MLQNIKKLIREYPGLTRKRDIYRITNQLQAVTDFGDTIGDFGEDAAVVERGNEFLLLAADGIWPGLIEDNPYGAGKAAVMASVNDIYAMGGRPLAMVNVIGIPDKRYYGELARGIRKGCEKFRVPMVGGHLHPDAAEVSLSVAILGAAKKLLLSINAQPGQDIIFAVDLQGRGYQCKPVLSWDTNSGKTSEQVLLRLEVLPQLAERGLCRTCKDVSNAGLLGTIALLLETSQKGAEVSIDTIPLPQSYPLEDWLRAFLSFGFVLCADKHNTDEIIRCFSDQRITACTIGTVIEERALYISYEGRRDILFDFEREDITGIAV